MDSLINITTIPFDQIYKIGEYNNYNFMNHSDEYLLYDAENERILKHFADTLYSIHNPQLNSKTKKDIIQVTIPREVIQTIITKQANKTTQIQIYRRVIPQTVKILIVQPTTEIQKYKSTIRQINFSINKLNQEVLNMINELD